jgi:hypothetical protein
MKLEGSCHCGAVRFRLESHTPYPFMRCYCSICRKTAGTGGFAINLMGVNDTLQVTGKRSIGVYRAKIGGEESEARRHFCRKCGSALWLWDPRWPDLIHPHAGAAEAEAVRRHHARLDGALVRPAWRPQRRPLRRLSCRIDRAMAQEPRAVGGLTWTSGTTTPSSTT